MCRFVTTTNNFRPRCAFRAFFAFALAFAVFFPSAARAQIFSDDAARELAAKNAAQLKDLARIVENMRGQFGEITQKQQSMDSRLRELVGQVEEAAARRDDKAALRALEDSAFRAEAARDTLSEELAVLRRQFADINQFITLPPEQEFYESSFADYRREEYAAAVAGFRKLLQYYPDGKFNASARYWMSESFLALGEYEPAAETARELISLHEGGDKAPDAMLTLARALRHLEREEESRAILESLLAAHPTTLAADRAREMLSP